MNKYRKIGLFILLAAITWSATAESPKRFPWRKSVLPGEIRESLSRIRLDTEIYAEIDRPERDLRLFDANGKEYPFALRIARDRDRTREVLTRRPSAITAMEREGKKLRLKIRRNSTEQPVALLKIRTAARDFDKRITLSAITADGKKIELGSGPFFDYSSRVDLRSDTLRFPAVFARELILEIDNYQEIRESPESRIVTGDRSLEERRLERQEPKIDDIELFSIRREPAEIALVPYSPEVRSREESGQTTVLRFSANRAPLTQIKVVADQPNFVRPYTLRNDQGEIIASGTLRRIAGILSETTIALPQPDRSTEYELRIENHNNPPLSGLFPGAVGIVHELWFQTPGETLTLTCAYGGPGHSRPQYEVSEILGHLPHLEPPNWQLGPGRLSPAYRPYGARRRNLRWAYYSAMALTAIAVGIILVRSRGKVKVEGE